MQSVQLSLLLAASACLQLASAVPVLNAPSCPEAYGVQTYAHPEACDHFFLCTNGTLTLEQCENGLLYDGQGSVHNHCNYHWAVECGPRKALLEPINAPGCEFKYGIYPESAACSTNYIKCADAVPYQTPCDPGLAYDAKTHKCNWPDELLDTCNPEAVVGFKCPEKLDPHSPSAKFWPFPRFPVPNDCERLITCVKGFPRLITCGDNKVFDENTLTCEEPENVPRCAHFKRK
ncbi:protein obstructor-E [Nilaparvata lugens]|uniref:Cuticular protein n=1 Tax=Nilaparvata lugens TaxID=108931 RepID=A0A2S1ZS43_NILLU|nr:protein obstructor-E [Nilaparvata lugens]AWK28287.1 cuticular protein [Nilaparvata lugens]